MAVPNICCHNVSPKVNTLFVIIMVRPSIRASMGMSLKVASLSRRYSLIERMAWSVCIFVYMDTASAVKSCALDGRLMDVSCCLSSLELLR